MQLNASQIELIKKALDEDISDPKGIIPRGDHSSLAAIPKAKEGRAQLLVKADGVLAGVEVAKTVCTLVDENLLFEPVLEDGALVKKGSVAFRVYGEVKSILRAERVLLNFMQRMSGIATHTKKFVDAVRHTSCKILDTRKTTPALRFFEKWAVRIGGGHNHRYGLYDMILLKDNHIDFCGGVEQAIDAAVEYLQRHNLNLKIEIEARTMDDIKAILKKGNVHRIMFDNFSPEEAAEAVSLVNQQYETEISGGINLENVVAYAETGVDYISVGALTHSSPALDLSLKAF
ncbi:MAG: carboxylating nicotinate-nucleotide diphosphorylase [Chitinophagales bacterium]|nr:carboxylating nicotinate-nucleotide diphosphorylase [Chitinophagales bacterium]